MGSGRIWMWVLGACLCLAGCTPPPADRPEAARPDVPKRPAVADADDWCAGHGVPESMCTLCNPELLPRFVAAGDYCKEHRLPESVCPACNPLAPPTATGSTAATARAPKAAPKRPAVADADDWCTPHAVPESMCTICNPELLPLFRAAGDYCEEHRLPESVCPACNPLPPPLINIYADEPVEHGGHDAHGEHHDRPPPAAPAEGAPPGPVAPGTRIRFRDPAIAAAAGLTTSPVTRGALARHISAPARLDHDRNRLADVRAPVPGIVRAVEVDLGARVEAGQPLFTLESAHIGDLQARLDAARARLDAARAEVRRRERLKAAAIASDRQLDEARRDRAAAAAALRGIEGALRIGGAEDGGGRFVVRAPIDGVVTRRPAVLGTYADASISLATITDPARKWAMLEVPEARAAALAPGQRVSLTVTGLPGAFTGALDFVAGEVDPRTRAVTARAVVPDPEGRLRAGAYARATVELDAPADGLTVPSGAIQRVGGGAVVFVRADKAVYVPRPVEVVRTDGQRAQIDGDVEVGEPVVVEGAFLLRTELMRDAIGAGCCEVEEPGR